MIDGYIAYLSMLDEKLKKFFENQKPYIFCNYLRLEIKNTADNAFLR